MSRKGKSIGTESILTSGCQWLEEEKLRVTTNDNEFLLGVIQMFWN